MRESGSQMSEQSSIEYNDRVQIWRASSRVRLYLLGPARQFPVKRSQLAVMLCIKGRVQMSSECQIVWEHLLSLPAFNYAFCTRSTD